MCSFLKNAKKDWITPPYNPRVKSPTSERGLLARRFNQFNAPYILLNSYFNFSSGLPRIVMNQNHGTLMALMFCLICLLQSPAELQLLLK